MLPPSFLTDFDCGYRLLISSYHEYNELYRWILRDTKNLNFFSHENESKLWRVFSEMLKCTKNQNISEKIDFKRITLQTNWILFIFTVLFESSANYRVFHNICLKPNNFLRQPVDFQTILECSPNSSQSFCVQTSSENIATRA